MLHAILETQVEPSHHEDTRPWLGYLLEIPTSPLTVGETYMYSTCWPSYWDGFRALYRVGYPISRKARLGSPCRDASSRRKDWVTSAAQNEMWLGLELLSTQAKKKKGSDLPPVRTFYFPMCVAMLFYPWCRDRVCKDGKKKRKTACCEHRFEARTQEPPEHPTRSPVNN